VTVECQQLNANIQPTFTLVFGHLTPKPLTVSAETETLATPFYRNRKQTETAFSIGFGAKTDGKCSFGLFFDITAAYKT